MSAPRAGAGYAARGGAGRHIRPHRAGLLQNAPDLAIGEPVPHGEHGHQRPFGKPFTGQFVTFKVDVPVPRVHESLTAGGDIQRRASVAPDQLGSLFAADDLHQFFTLFLPTQRDAERNGKTCPALGPDECPPWGMAAGTAGCPSPTPRRGMAACPCRRACVERGGDFGAGPVLHVKRAPLSLAGTRYTTGRAPPGCPYGVRRPAGG